jgi:hypothetical protein
MEKAIAQAEQQADSTGQPQQVVAVDSKGVTTTTVVQPRSQGQTVSSLTTTSTPPPAAGPLPPPQDPTVTPWTGNAPAPGGVVQNNAPGNAAASGAPLPQTVTLPAGTNLAVRIDRTISVKTSQPGDTFTGEIVEPVTSHHGDVLIPKGTPVGGVIDAAQKRGHFKGASDLELRLTSMTLDGVQRAVRTADLTEEKKGKGKRSAALIGGGTGLGALIGGLAGGGKGALIGGLAGAGAGTAGAGLTDNRDLTIPAESVVHFQLSQDMTVQKP